VTKHGQRQHRITEWYLRSFARMTKSGAELAGSSRGVPRRWRAGGRQPDGRRAQLARPTEADEISLAKFLALMYSRSPPLGDADPARPGTWLRMAPEVKHSLVARTPMQMALYLLPR
jgi:hypothetical protein